MTYEIRYVRDGGYIEVSDESYTFLLQMPNDSESIHLYNDIEVSDLDEDSVEYKECQRAIRDIEEQYTNTELSIAAKVGNFYFYYDCVNRNKNVCVVFDVIDKMLRYFVDGSEVKDLDELERQVDNLTLEDAKEIANMLVDKLLKGKK